MIRTISPSTNKVVCEVPETTVDEARSIARASQDAFAEYSRMPFQQRKDIVVRALKTIQERKMELGKELTAQMGRPISFSHKEIETMQKRADYLLETAEEALQSIPGKPEAGFQRWVKKVPIGPVLVVFAWNVSFLNTPSPLRHAQAHVYPSSRISSSSTHSSPPFSRETPSFSSPRPRLRSSASGSRRSSSKQASPAMSFRSFNLETWIQSRVSFRPRRSRE